MNDLDLVHIKLPTGSMWLKLLTSNRRRTGGCGVFDLRMSLWLCAKTIQEMSVVVYFWAKQFSCKEVVDRNSPYTLTLFVIISGPWAGRTYLTNEFLLLYDTKTLILEEQVDGMGHTCNIYKTPVVLRNWTLATQCLELLGDTSTDDNAKQV